MIEVGIGKGKCFVIKFEINIIMEKINVCVKKLYIFLVFIFFIFFCLLILLYKMKIDKKVFLN